MSIPSNVRENSGFGLPRPPAGPLFSRSLGNAPPTITSTIDIEGRPQVSSNYILLPRLNGAKLQQRQLLFVMRVKSKAVRYTAWNICNLTQMNTILRDAGELAVNLLKSQEQIESSIPQSELRSLLLLEEGSWDKHPAYQKLSEYDDLRYIRGYLRAADIMDLWMPNGVLLGDMSVGQESTPNQIFSALLKGWCEIEDVWGAAARPGLDLYLILKRVYDAQNNKWTSFQFVPYVLPGDVATVPPNETMYYDYSGTKQYGITYRVGTVTDRPAGTTSEQQRLVEAGLVKPRSAMDPSISYGSISKLEIYNAAAPGFIRRYDT